MELKIRKIKLPMLIALLLLLFTALFSLIFALFGRGEEYESNANSTTINTADPADISEEHIEPITTIIQMTPADISRGSLILVNSDFPYDAPDEPRVIPVSDAKTDSYMVVNENIALLPEVIRSLNDMMDAFYAETGLNNVTIRSAFRSFEQQQSALDAWIATVGAEEAARWAALPGHSEHHTGLAIDFGIYNNGELSVFNGDGDHAWFRYNAYRFGFILRFTEALSNITGVADEPWHYRYVGVPHAYFIYRRGWALEEYLAFLRDFRSDDPFTGYYDGMWYEIFFTNDIQIEISIDAEFNISGNNIDEFIVTIKHSRT